MKSNHPLSLYNADNPPKDLNQGTSSPASQSTSPYLKAILSATRELSGPGNESHVTDPDRTAALRYIKQSASLKKLYIKKMSC